MLGKKGFTLIEVLVVIMIIGILASIATPLYLRHTRRARASEAVGTMGLIRQALRDYRINNNTYYDVMATLTADGNIQNALPTSVLAGVPTPITAGVDVDAGVTQYFSNRAYSVDATTPAVAGASGMFLTPNVQDFLITVNGTNGTACAAAGDTNCAVNAAQVVNFDLEMDNSGRVFISYDNGTTWAAY